MGLWHEDWPIQRGDRMRAASLGQLWLAYNERSLIDSAAAVPVPVAGNIINAVKLNKATVPLGVQYYVETRCDEYTCTVANFTTDGLIDWTWGVPLGDPAIEVSMQEELNIGDDVEDCGWSHTRPREISSLLAGGTAGHKAYCTDIDPVNWDWNFTGVGHTPPVSPSDGETWCVKGAYDVLDGTSHANGPWRDREGKAATWVEAIKQWHYTDIDAGDKVRIAFRTNIWRFWVMNDDQDDWIECHSKMYTHDGSDWWPTPLLDSEGDPTVVDLLRDGANGRRAASGDYLCTAGHDTFNLFWNEIYDCLNEMRWKDGGVGWDHDLDEPNGETQDGFGEDTSTWQNARDNADTAWVLDTPGSSGNSAPLAYSTLKMIGGPLEFTAFLNRCTNYWQVTALSDEYSCELSVWLKGEAFDDGGDIEEPVYATFGDHSAPEDGWGSVWSGTIAKEVTSKDGLLIGANGVGPGWATEPAEPPDSTSLGYVIAAGDSLRKYDMGGDPLQYV